MTAYLVFLALFAAAWLCGYITGQLRERRRCMSMRTGLIGIYFPGRDRQAKSAAHLN